MNRLAQIRARQEELRSLMIGFADRDLNDDEARSLDEAASELDTLTTEAEPLERRAAVIERARTALEAGQATRQAGTPDGGTVRGGGSALTVSERDSRIHEALNTDRNAPARGRKLADEIIRANEDYLSDMNDKESKAFTKIVRRHARSDANWAENILARSTDTYVEGWSKVITGREFLLTPDEQRAIVVGTNTQGGYLVPTFLDPTLILLNPGGSNAIRSLPGVRQVTLTSGETWNGVTTNGVTASWDGELEEVSDDSPTFDTVGIGVKKAQAFVQASVEAFSDIANLDTDVRLLLAQAKDDLEGEAFLNGAVGTRPPGIFPTLAALTAQRVQTTTAGTIGEIDINNTYTALRDKYRRRAVWLMNTRYGTAIHRLGTAVSSAYSGDLRDAPSDVIMNRPAVYADDAPYVQTTTALDQIAAFFDPSALVIVDKPGSFSIQYIPTLFGTNLRPKGAVGWYGWWRVGAGFPDTGAGVILVDKTSA